MAWVVEFYQEAPGRRAPVEEFLAELPMKHKAKALGIVKRLEEVGMNLPFPYSSQVRGRIRELRTQQGKDKIRILYFADARRWFILLHGIVKRASKLDEQDIRTAERRMNLHNAWLRNRKGDNP